MAMLAEPRRKQKVINLRAKNSEWSKDASKFGQRMLEKMGWTSGKGLGAKENGIVEHVVARYKNDEKGLGFEDKNDQWTKHEDDFNSLLANLSNANEDTKVILHSGVSLEDKSKKSKARIHYHKFTRGKDLSRYSEKDLANIFGKKSFKEEEQAEKDNTKDNDATTTEQVFTEKGSMEDYFRNKMAAFKNSKTVTKNDESNNGYSDLDDSANCGFQGFSGTTNIVCNLDNRESFNIMNSCSEPIDSTNDTNCENQLKIKKKKKKKCKEEPQENLCDNTIKDKISVEKYVTKKSKRKQDEENVQSSNKKQKVSQDIHHDTGKMEDCIDNTVKKVKKRKKKKDKDL